MSDFQPPLIPERNPVTAQKHRREVLWQITVPLIIGIILVLALAVFITVVSYTGNGSAASLWADISLIWLIIPAFIGGLILLVLLAGLAYGIYWLVQNLPTWALQAQNIIVTVGVNVRKATDLAVEPVLRVEGAVAGLRTLFRRK